MTIRNDVGRSTMLLYRIQSSCIDYGLL